MHIGLPYDWFFGSYRVKYALLVKQTEGLRRAEEANISYTNYYILHGIKYMIFFLKGIC